MEYLKKHKRIYLISQKKYFPHLDFLFKILNKKLIKKSNFLSKIRLLFGNVFFLVDFKERLPKIIKKEFKILLTGRLSFDSRKILRIIKKFNREDIAIVKLEDIKNFSGVKCEVFTYGGNGSDLEIIDKRKDSGRVILKLKYKGSIAPLIIKNEEFEEFYLAIILFLIKIFQKNFLESISLVEGLERKVYN